MKKRNWLMISITVMFVALSGILYSCKSNSKPETQIVLQSEEDYQEQNVNSLISDESFTQDGKQSDELKSNNDTKQSKLLKSKQDDNTELSENSQNIDKNVAQHIVVHICGAVKKPDVYEVEDDSRLIDIIKLAGGLTADAAGDYVNQAALVEDGQQVYIPTKKEVKDKNRFESLTGVSNQQNSSSKDSINNTKATSRGSTSSSKININTATLEELMTLTGIGESKANSIITYRQDNGSFKDIEEIKNISGIKDSTYNKICDFITVE